MNISKSTMLSTIKKVTLFTLLLGLLMTPSTVQAKKSTSKKSIKTSTTTNSSKKKKKSTKKKSKKIQWKKDKKTVYAKDNIIIYSSADTSSTKISTYITNDKIKILATSNDGKWYQIRYKARKRYITANDTSSTKSKKYLYKGKRLTKSAGVCYGPSGRETYYNMRMNGVISYMRDKGYSASRYPYWIRDDGCKMLGKYIIIACNLKIRPKGTLVKTSLGTGIVCDTGGFARHNPSGIDIATDWR